MQERRKLPRWMVNREVRMKLEGQAREISCLIKDINFKGMQIALNFKLNVDSYINFSLALSYESSLNTRAWVAWHRQVDGRDIYGLYFNKLTKEDEDKIYQFLYHNIQRGASEGGEKMEDRRIFQRFNYRLGARLLNLNNGNEMVAETSDVSAKGIGLVLRQEVPINTPLEAWLQIPDTGEPLYARGIAAWSKRDSENQYRIGMDLERADLMGLSRILRA
ncbi:MAG: PilZ domain-containing protein [Candidatus Omnitrophica bacterium]|nr:PilZ domain-containing protein [Candidatus Omnitrophota bacterium]